MPSSVRGHPDRLVPTATIEEILAAAASRGFIGHGDLTRHLRHARGYGDAWRHVSGSAPLSPREVADLGSGGGLPGLVLAEEWPGAHFVLIEANHRRAAFLRWAIAALTRTASVDVVTERAEAVAQRPDFRATFDLVVARSFGPPSVTAECAAGLLVPDGLLVVSEPPGEPGQTDTDRWPSGPLQTLGLDVLPVFRSEFTYAILRQVQPCPARYPRRVGIPAKRPLF